jgi:RNA polymerase sporulation-specific sigma factor
VKKAYEDLNDEELIMMLREGEQAVTDFLMNKYKNLVRSRAKSMYILGADTEDLIQEGMIGLFKAIRDYDFGRDASFYTFANLCVTRQIYTAVEASGRKKHMPLNSYVSFYSEVKQEKDGKKLELSGMLESEEKNPEENIIDQENVEYIEQIIQSQLSSLERQVLDLHITDMAISEISKILGIDEKSADNALQRAKSKIRKAMQEK